MQIGHRKSIDIDLFSDVPYGTIDFNKLTEYLEASFPYVDHFSGINPAMGKSYFIGENIGKAVKLDIFYTDNFIQPPFIEDAIRMATLEEIIAMKLDIIQRGGRKKDFWDVHALLDSFSIDEMLQWHEKRYPYGHNKELILNNFIDFSWADDDFDPICLLGKYWEFIKEDIQEYILHYRNSTK